MISTHESKLGQSVKMTELYDYLELTPTYYNRWIKKELYNNPYFTINQDYCTYIVNRSAGRFRKEFSIKLNTAKKICLSMMKTNKKANELYIELLKINDGIVIIPTKSRKELLFEINLNETLNGITKIIPQYSVLNYRIDFYLSELNIAIEYYENHHLSQKAYDEKRQKEIQKLLKCDFIRVPEYCELKAINEILKLILHKSLSMYQYNGDLSEIGDNILSKLNIKTIQEEENERLIETLNKRK